MKLTVQDIYQALDGTLVAAVNHVEMRYYHSRPKGFVINVVGAPVSDAEFATDMRLACRIFNRLVSEVKNNGSN